MMDRLEKSSGQTVITLAEAKSLLKLDDDFIVAVYDYWLNKRLKMVHLKKNHPFLSLYLFQIFLTAQSTYSTS